MKAAKAFGQAVRELRKNQGLTQEHIALESGLSLVYVNDIENGKRNVSIETIVKLAKALKVSPSQLLEGIR